MKGPEDLPEIMNNFIRKHLALAVIAIFCLFTLVFSLWRYGVNDFGERRILYFKSMDTSATVCEDRFIRVDGGMDEVSAFVDELLLGPMTNRFVRLFPLGTKAEVCFLQGDTLFVDLSADALLSSPETCTVKEGVRMLKENIVKNFTNINTVDVFIDGMSAWN